MPKAPPSHPLFDKAPGLSKGVTADPADWYGLPADDKERALLQTVKERIAKRMQENRVVFQPELLIRTYVGDQGIRPYSGTFWQSPDIWLAVGDPSTAPAIPPMPGGIAAAGTANTLYAHIWNLGMAPVAGVSVEFLVFNPSLGFAGQTPLFRAVTRGDLAGRSNPYECHKLVKCPVAWVPTVVNGGHECVIVRVAGVGDPMPATHQFEPASNRHVGQRNIHVAAYQQSFSQLLDQLKQTLPRDARMTFWQVGEETQPMLALVSPGLRVNPEIETAQIGEIHRAPEPAPGQATVVQIRAADGQGRAVGGYTLVLTAMKPP